MPVASVPDPYDEQTMDAQMAASHYSYKGFYTTSKSALKTGSLGWIYDRPSNSYRIRDFKKYYHDAPPCLMQAAGTEFAVDMVRDNPYGFPFYILFRNAHPSITNKKFEKGVGISNATAVSNSTYFASCMTIEDLYTDDGYGSTYKVLDQYNPSYLGWVIFPAVGNNVYEYFSQVPLAGQSSSTAVDNDMFILNLTNFSATLNLDMGYYTAVACARRAEEGLYSYMPVYGNSGFPARFTLDVGGLRYYPIQYVGVSESIEGPYTQTLTTSGDAVFIKIVMYNRTDRQVSIHVQDGTQGQVLRAKVTLGVTIDPIIYSGTGSSEVPYTTRWSQALVPPTTSGGQTVNANTINIDSGSSGAIIYKLSNIWSTDGGTSQPQYVDSNSQITISPKLNFRNTIHYYPLFGGGNNWPSYTIYHG
jgi:hypothetical protein